MVTFSVTFTDRNPFFKVMAFLNTNVTKTVLETQLL